MNPEQRVQTALRTLAEQDRAREASATAAEIFAKRPGARRPWVWIGLSAAAVVTIAITSWAWKPAAPRLIPEVAVEQRPPSVDPPPTQVAVAKVAPSKRIRRANRTASPAEPPQEIVTEFFPLMDSPPPFERGQLVRMVVPASTMRTVGLPVAPERWGDRIQADVLVGEEGMARAIRFVSFRQ